MVPGLDPRQLVTAAARHGLSAYLADAFHEANVAWAGERELLADARNTVAGALRLRKAGVRLLEAFGQAGLSPIALKGPVLAQRLYANPLVRPSTDLDVLVAPGELERARAALESLGQRQVHDPALADPFEDHHHLSYVGPLGLVELHFRLTHTFGGGHFDDEAVRARAVSHAFEHLSVRVLAPEDEFLYLATHAANHAFIRVSWLVDLERLLRSHPALDFETMGRRARAAGFLQPVAVALDLVERCLGVSLPAQARSAFGVRRRRRFVDGLFFDERAMESASLSAHRLASFALRLWMMDTAGRVARELRDGAMRYVRRAVP